MGRRGGVGFDVLAVISLLLCAVAALHVPSYYALYRTELQRRGGGGGGGGGAVIPLTTQSHFPAFQDFAYVSACVVACAVVPVLWLCIRAVDVWVWRVRSRRMRRGLCAGCGYDLRGSEGRCPECGEGG